MPPLSTFLLGDSPPAPQPLPAAVSPDSGTGNSGGNSAGNGAGNGAGTLDAGRGHYMALCASCHGSEGLGRSLTMPPLKGKDRKSTRLNSSHLVISYAVFCLKKKKSTSFTRSSVL